MLFTHLSFQKHITMYTFALFLIFYYFFSERTLILLKRAESSGRQRVKSKNTASKLPKEALTTTCRYFLFNVMGLHFCLFAVKFTLCSFVLIDWMNSNRKCFFFPTDWKGWFIFTDNFLMINIFSYHITKENDILLLSLCTFTLWSTYCFIFYFLPFDCSCLIQWVWQTLSLWQYLPTGHPTSPMLRFSALSRRTLTFVQERLCGKSI